MDEAKTHEIRQWLFKARHDLRSASRLFTDEPPILDTAAYHCQQAAEKALKAFLVLHDVQFSKIHLPSFYLWSSNVSMWILLLRISGRRPRH